jgi:cyclophilin family peptidyl-prolyl cis-trans isomerase
MAESAMPFAERVDPRTLPASALIETTRGAFEIAFYRETSPVTVRNFVYLVEKDLIRALVFGLVKPGFIVQGGDAPDKQTLSKLSWTIPAEFSEIKNEKGTVGMRRAPSPVNPERRSDPSHFYISLTASPHLDGRYSVFGRVVSGMDVVEQIAQGDRILGVKLGRVHPLGSRR